MVCHLLSIKDEETDKDRCIQEILDLEKRKMHYTQDIFAREEKLHELIHLDHKQKTTMKEQSEENKTLIDKLDECMQESDKVVEKMKKEQDKEIEYQEMMIEIARGKC